MYWGDFAEHKNQLSGTQLVAMSNFKYNKFGLALSGTALLGPARATISPAGSPRRLEYTTLRPFPYPWDDQLRGTPCVAINN